VKWCIYAKIVMDDKHKKSKKFLAEPKMKGQR